MNWQDFQKSNQDVTVFTRGSDLSAFANRIPDEWIAAMSDTSSKAILRMWETTATTLPLFWNYLQHSLMDIALLDGPTGPALIYIFRDWEEYGWDGFFEGIMIASLPSGSVEIQSLETKFGELPASLKTFWQKHATTLLKNNASLASPEAMPQQHDLHLRTLHTHYLAIADTNKAVSLCLENASASSWQDKIVQVFRDDPGATCPYTSQTFDELLVDWQYSKYIPVKHTF